MISTGKKNLITDVDGVLVGNSHDEKAFTGCTVITPIEGSIASADVRGGAPGTREVGALNPYNLVDTVDSIVLSGGSTWGLEAASSVGNYIGSQGRGYKPSEKSKDHVFSHLFVYLLCIFNYFTVIPATGIRLPS